MTVQKDGYSTKITFADDASVSVWEKEVTPPGIEGGGAIDTTTMHNITWRTQFPKSLKTMSECSFSAAYDPAVLNDIISMINSNQLITITFPDGDAIQFWGWIDTFVPGTNAEGEQPSADCTIIPSNENDTGVETGPVYSA